jgi:uncharacterized protein (TIGR02271 family)
MMNTKSSQTTDPNYVVGFFSEYSDAESAIHDLTEAGIPANRIAVATAGSGTSTHPSDGGESFWQKIANFFEGKDHNYGDDSAASADDLSRYGNLKQDGVLVSVSTVSPEERQEAEDIFEEHNAQLEGAQVQLSAQSGSDVERSGTQRLQLLSEVLRVHKERVPTGEVRLRKEVIMENQSVEVPVTREELVIERRPVEGGAAASSQIGSDREIRVPLSEEQVRVEKRPVVKEEVRVGKKKVRESRQVNEQVKHEELKVDREADVNRERKKGIA